MGEELGVFRRTYVEIGVSPAMSLDESLRLTLWRYLRGRKGDERQNDYGMSMSNRLFSGNYALCLWAKIRRRMRKKWKNGCPSAGGPTDKTGQLAEK